MKQDQYALPIAARPFDPAHGDARSTDLSIYTLHKLPPQARELEEAVLGAIMLEAGVMLTVADLLTEDCFYVPQNKLVYGAIRNLNNRGTAIDILTVTEELKNLGKLEDAGGAFYVTELTCRVASAYNVEYHARIIQQKYMQREVIRICSKGIREAYEDTTDVFDLLDNTERAVLGIREKNIHTNADGMVRMLGEAVARWESLRNRETTLTGVPTGLTCLDRVTGGWQRPDLIIIAARPGMGKTACAVTIARNAAMDYRVPVAIFSLEMSKQQLIDRMICGEADVDSSALRRGDLKDSEWDRLFFTADKVGSAEVPIYIDDTPAIRIFDLKAKCRRMKKQYGIGLFIFDYLQLGTVGDERRVQNREQEISMITREMKSIAKELDTPFIALSQLSRETEARAGKRPQLSDLRESGAIEQDADVVIFLYRAEYYGLEPALPDEGNSEMIVAKHRNGPLKTVYVDFLDRLCRFTERDNLKVF